MRIVRNERHISIRAALGKYGVLGGLLALLAGLIISLSRPEQIASPLVSTLLALVPLGFVLAVVGGYFADRYVGPLAHHDALAAVLKGLDNRHVLLQYVLPAPHVLLAPGSLTAIVVKTQRGQVTCQEAGRWKHRDRGRFFRQLMGQEAVRAPDFEAERQVIKLQRWLSSQLPGVDVPVRAVIVFVNPDVVLDADASPVPTFYGKKVKAWLRGPGKLSPLPPNARRQVEQVTGIAPAAGAE